MATTKSVSRDLLSLESKSTNLSSRFLIHQPGGDPFNFPNTSPTSTNTTQAPVQTLDGSHSAAKLKTFPMPPPSALLARVAAFLPQMEKANKQLEEAIARSGRDHIDIENIEDDSKPHIEMNLDCGVLEVRASDDVECDPVIIIPGVTTPSTLSSNVAQSVSSGSDSDHDESDDDDDDRFEPIPFPTNPHSSTPFVQSNDSSASDKLSNPSTSSSSSTLSRAARKKKKYIARSKAKHVAASPNPLIQEMEE